MSLIELRNVSKRFGRLVVLRDLTLDIEPGQSIVIIGASGSGKSVMLKHVVGLLRPDTGEVHFDGQRLDNLPERKLSELRTSFGFLFQMGALFDSLTVHDNVAFPLVEHTAKPPAEIAQTVREKLAMVGLPDAGPKMPGELSGGQKKRVALARAIVNRPAIILADEPTGNLDSENSAIVLNMFQEMNYRFNQTIIMITHNPEAAAMCRRIVQMRDGQIVAPNTGLRV